MEIANITYLVNAFEAFIPNIYVRALVTLVLFFSFSKLAVYIFEKIFLRLASKTVTDIDDVLVEHTKNPISLILLLLGIIIAVQQIGLRSQIESIVEKGLTSIIIVILGIMAVRIADVFLENWGTKVARRTKSKKDDSIIRLFHKILMVIAYILVFLYILSFWGIEIGPMIASLGIAGLAIAFALQNTLGNIFGGISMILDKSIRSGDVVQIDAQTSGVVLEVGIRSTKIKTWDNEVIIIPNGQLSNQQIHNIALPDPQVRVVVKFGVAYGSDVEKVRQLVMKEIRKVKNFVPEPEPFVRFMEMGDSALLFRALFWVPDYTMRFDAKEEATTRIYNALNKAKIVIPFPQMDVWIKEHRK